MSALEAIGIFTTWFCIGAVAGAIATVIVLSSGKRR